ncbi:MAG: aspartate aminotransferase family protein [Paludibacteraceae bacterium]|nr:aspartate aminotransferase family protein [Paludibacteraceae bacterium]
MNPFNVYNLFNVTPVSAHGCTIKDDKGQEFLDMYAGNAVMNIGHSHPKYIQAVTDQLQQLTYCSNMVKNPLQDQLALRLGKMTGYDDYSLFLCNSGAEAVENALKLASFHTGRQRVIAFKRGYHGRTSGAGAVTDNPSISSLFNRVHKVIFLDINDTATLKKELETQKVAAVIIEPIQGTGGVHTPQPEFMQTLELVCRQTETMLIMDEIQTGFGRTGKFFAHQWLNIHPDLICIGKPMANGLPCAGVMIAPHFEAVKGRLGTTLAGNYVTMAAALSVLDVLEKDNLMANAKAMGDFLKEHIPASPRIKEVRGKGLMIGIEFRELVAPIRQKLLYDKHIITGSAGMNVIRLLPPLCITQQECYTFINALKAVL